MPRDMMKPDLYPALEPYRQGFLAVSPPHQIYWEECGNPKGVPVVFLHGGPGGGSAPAHRRFFDPEYYRIVIFDQRGAGRSTPLACIDQNSPDELVADIEALRQHLNIDRWLVFGGSWGSTLALCYAQAHPDQVTGLILRGIFLMQRYEIDWFLYGMRTIFPDAWQRFADLIPHAERDDLLDAYYRRLTDPDRAVWVPAARAWCAYETACSTLLPSVPQGGQQSGDLMAIGGMAEQQALAFARIEAHYFKHHVFLPDDRLLRGVEAIRHIPTVVVQGRYDIVCPPITAEQLRRHWPEIDLMMIPDAGHSAMEPGIRAALVTATNAFRYR